MTDKLANLVDALTAVVFSRDELPAWEAHVSEYVGADGVVVLDPNLIPSGPFTRSRTELLPLCVIASRPLSGTEQEAAVRLFIAKRSRSDTSADRPAPALGMGDRIP